jgi:hypothetical protein
MYTMMIQYWPLEVNWVISNGLVVMVFSATFNNISIILWLTVLLVEETRVPGGENHWPAASHCTDKFD